MGRTFRYLFAMLWGAVPALALFFLLRPLRLRRLEGKGLSSPVRREVALALFWMFCGGAALLGLTPRWVVPALAGLPLGMPWNQAGLPFFSPGTVSLVPFLTFSYSAYILAFPILSSATKILNAKKRRIRQNAPHIQQRKTSFKISRSVHTQTRSLTTWKNNCCAASSWKRADEIPPPLS